MAHGVSLSPTPTGVSHLNRIECHFWAWSDSSSTAPSTRLDRVSKATQAYIRRRGQHHHDPGM